MRDKVPGLLKQLGDTFHCIRCMGRARDTTFQAPMPCNLNVQFSAVAPSYI